MIMAICMGMKMMATLMGKGMISLETMAQKTTKERRARMAKDLRMRRMRTLRALSSFLSSKGLKFFRN